MGKHRTRFLVPSESCRRDIFSGSAGWFSFNNSVQNGGFTRTGRTEEARIGAGAAIVACRLAVADENREMSLKTGPPAMAALASNHHSIVSGDEMCENLLRMDEIFGVMEGKLRVSIADSTMMWIVHSAMDKAHERVKSKDGIFERLNEISRFYELAVIQLEGCVKFVQEEADTFPVESNHEELLSGLADIRNRLQQRLRESELAISDKDRDLMERFDNESRLKQIIDEKERELAFLRENLEMERTKSEIEPKNPVDEQGLDVPQKLEADDERYHGVSDEEVDQMGSDIDVLKETLDYAFGKMQNAILASDTAPIEQQFRSSVEKNTLSVLLTGFMTDVKESCEAEMRSSFFLGENLSNLVREIQSFGDDLELFGNFELVKTEESKPLEDHNGGIEGSSDEKQEDGSHYVAKMIKNHESIIRKKSKEAEELIRLKQEILREKSTSSWKGEKDMHTFKKRIQDFVVKLQSLMVCTSPCIISSSAGVWEERKQQENEGKEDQISRLKQEKQDSDIQCMLREEIYMTIFKALIDKSRSDFSESNRIMEDITHESLIREEISWIVCDETIEDIVKIATRSVAAKFSDDLIDFSEIPDQSGKTFGIEGDVVMVVFRETIKEWKEGMKNFSMERHIKQESDDQSLSTAKSENMFGCRETISDSVRQFSQGISKGLEEFEFIANKKLRMTIQRLEELKKGVNPPAKLIHPLKQKEELYRKAFINRCQNLQKAEIEVDLLGDQVDGLLCLLEKINVTLRHFSPALQHHFDVSDLLEKIKKEL